MLIDFSVANFRSIARPLNLSLIANKGDRLPNNLMVGEDILNRNDLRLLRSALMYGPNASGKSNICRAILAMRECVVRSATELSEGDALPHITPFRLHSELAAEPTSFEIRVLIQGIVYRYGFKATADKVVSEWLYQVKAQSKSRETLLFSREGDDPRGWVFGNAFRGAPALLRQRTRVQNGLLLSKAAQENYSQITPLYIWFRNKLRVINMAARPLTMIMQAADDCEQGRFDLNSMTRILKVADSGIEKLETTTKHITFSEEFRNFITSTMDLNRSDLPEEVDQPVFSIVRQQSDRSRNVAFEIEDESNGTQRFLVIGKLLVDSLYKGATTIIDEIECSLHPMLVREILSSVHDPDLAPQGAQFVFATHDTNLLDFDILRRDQLFMVEKSAAHETSAYSLADLKPMPKLDAAGEKQYLAHRFGGMPSLGNLRLALADSLEEVRVARHG